ncbi:sensor histidine kinase [Thauera linaloolentis]|uniref:histidine kinase n=1 Tax=Thauera linaloolentis (strain DSM 12138 / JCM 21573 / CCUG 41526 / CIP 105981 / IAM 15112 / NBRC 102519 / 47Lol) TaxID=1123367 RepID=N6Z7P2_THAL4|nr:HAMP domain-containing sensor histidine kinase [Thauera linaloolentis]ENO90612.1 two component system sensor protein [Thauera linaloolentis 47Lol = DSM 12138]MCM8566118.1 HAMP domain-containing histidine kinase [Thauera linaloolentis]
MSAAASIASERSRRASLRFFNLFRLVLAGLFVVAGRELGLGDEAPVVFRFVAFAYLAGALGLGFQEVAGYLGESRVTALQVVIDVAALSLMMWASGGYSSGIPVLIMVMLAGAGLVAEGRMVLFFAALATIAVLIENVWRLAVGGLPVDFLQVGIFCTGFFGIALVARLLASRAQANASLAAERGEALAKQQAVNERIIRDMQDGVIVASGNGFVLQSNPQAAVLLGMDGCGSGLLEGLRLADIDPAFDEVLYQHGIDDRLLRIGPGGRLLRCRVVCGEPGSAAAGDTLIYLTDFEDIQRNLQQVKLAALGRLTASMAHEIRNPLSAVSQAAELLREEKRGEMQARLARIINDNAQRIERMIRDVLALGRREQALPEALPLAQFVAEVIDARVFSDPVERDLYAVDIDPSLSFAIDRAHLHQILDNLLANARRYCSGRPSAVALNAVPLAGERIALHVRDDGPGLDEATRLHLFEPFFTTHAKGTGLGLYIARELAEANDATLELAMAGPGADFILSGRQKP